MRCGVLLTAALLELGGCGDGGANGAELRVLFVGNSLTYYNDLPGMVEALGGAAGFPVAADMLASGGASMEEHVGGKAFRRVLSENDFDIVVLQEIGGWPLCPAAWEACARSLPSIRQAVRLVRAAGARPIWYSAWQVVPEFQRRLSEEVAGLAAEMDVEVADVGAAFQAYRAADGKGNLLLEDGHPDDLGSWLAAATILREIAGRDLPQSIELETACRTPWQGAAAPTRERLASEQPPPATECSVPGAERLALILRVANAAGS